MSMYASILAGGSGTRLWPLSTAAKPKQFLPLISDQTMLQETIQRLAPLAPIEQTFVVTFDQYRQFVQEQLPDLPPDHILAEPQGRGTAASIGLAATFIAAHDPTAVMGSFPADHLITDTEAFRGALRFAETLARAGHLVTLGIHPTYPEVGYGYIQQGKPLPHASGEFTAYQVQRFVEKPPLATAQAFVDSGEYSWNGGIFIWRVDRILAELRRHVPTVAAVLDRVAEGLRQGRATEALQEAWPALTQEVTIDRGVMEHAKDIVVIPVSMGWNDIGNWAQLATAHTADADRNVTTLHDPHGRHVAIETVDTFVYSTTGRTIATAGLVGYVVVDLGDELLICPKDQVHLIRRIVDEMKDDA
jgi:mannose-1-phosphate guanylyltransferase